MDKKDKDWTIENSEYDVETCLRYRLIPISKKLEYLDEANEFFYKLQLLLQCTLVHAAGILIYKKPVGVHLLSLLNIKNRSPARRWIALIFTSKRRVWIVKN